MKTITKLLSMALVLCAFNLNATNYFVKTSGSSSSSVDGKSWANAVTLYRAAALTTADNNDVIYVAAGDYDVSLSTQWYNISLSKGGVTLIGGFAGNESEATITPAMSNPTTNVTRFYAAAATANKIFAIGSGTSTNTITVKNINFEDITTAASPAFASVVFVGATSTSPIVIDGCNFRRLTLKSTTQSNAAAAMSHSGLKANLTIQNCNFENLTNENTGGGAFKLNFSVPGYTAEFKTCSFKTIALSGTAGTGGVIATYHTTVTTPSTGKATYKVTDCILDGCSALGNGGAIFTGQRQDWIISGSVFKNCTAGTYGGAIHIGGNALNNTTGDDSSDNLTITNSCIVSNTSTTTGKQAITYGIGLGNGVSITRSVITNNSNVASATGLRDIQNPGTNNTYSATESLLNQGYVSSADKTYAGSASYSDYLTATQLQTITNASTLSAAIAAGQTLIDQAKLATNAVEAVSAQNLLRFSNGILSTTGSITDMEIFSANGKLIQRVQNQSSFSTGSLNHGFYIAKAIIDGEAVTLKFVK